MIASVLIAALTVFLVVSQGRGFSLSELREQINTASTPWLILAAAGMFCFIIFEGCGLHTLIRGLTDHKDNTGGIAYSAADIYFSAITPSATGGQPASMILMRLDGIHGGEATVILIINLIMYTAVLLLIGLLSFFMCGDLFFNLSTLSQTLISIGFLVLIVLTVVFIILLLNEEIVRNIGLWFIRLCERFGITKKGEYWRSRLDAIILHYRQCAGAVSGKSGVMFRAFVFNLLQRLSQISVTLFVYLATGGSSGNLGSVWFYQAVTVIGSYCVPIPGAMGAADYLLLDGLGQISDITLPANIELLSRGISFYTCIIISAVITLIAFCRRRERS